MTLEPGEGRAVTLAFAFFACILASNSILKPVRESIATAFAGRQLSVSFLGTFLASLAVIPVYTFCVARLRRSTFVTAVYRVAGLVLLGFWVLLRALEGRPSRGAAMAYFVFASVFNVYAVTLFWSVAADVFRPGQARRLFPFIAAGGTAGGLLGSLLTVLFAGSLGTVNLLLLPVALVEVAALLARRLRRDAGGAERVAESPGDSAHREAPLGGRIADGARLVAKSPYLLGLAAYLFLATLSGTFGYFQQTAIVRASVADAAARTRLFGAMDLAVQALTLIGQGYLTTRIIRRFGLGAALLVLPLCHVVTFAAMGALPVLAVLVVAQVLRRAVGYGVATPSREALYAVVTRDEKYKAKGFIDTVIFRGGDVVSAFLYDGLAALGLGLGALAAVIAPAGLAWAAVGRRLARENAARVAAPPAADS